MIPQHLIDKAAQALQDRINSDYGLPAVPLDDLPEPWLEDRRTEARTVLEAVAADLYDEGYNDGRADGDCLSYTPHADRPYRASETN